MDNISEILSTRYGTPCLLVILINSWTKVQLFPSMCWLFLFKMKIIFYEHFLPYWQSNQGDTSSPFNGPSCSYQLSFLRRLQFIMTLRAFQLTLRRVYLKYLHCRSTVTYKAHHLKGKVHDKHTCPAETH